MSFSIFPRHAKYGHSSWKRQVVLNRTTPKADEPSLSVTTFCNDTFSSSDESDSSDSLVAQSQKEALDLRRSMDVKLDPTLYQRLQQDTGNGSGGDQSQVRKLKSSLRQVVSAPTSPQHGPSRRGSGSGKSVKFDPLHLEKVCFFEGTHSPNEVPRFEEIKVPPFKVLYSHWPPIQHTIFQQQQNVQLKRSLKLLEGGSILRGQVMVRNLGYEKHVEIRYTVDGWQSVKNVQASYSHSRGALDTFVYEIDIEQGMLDRGHLRVTVDMAVRYTVLTTKNQPDQHRPIEETFWDNNDGYNYQIQVVETASSSPTLAPTSSNIDEITGLDDDNERFAPPPPLKSSSTSSAKTASFRYDFGQSLMKAKHKPSSSSPLSSASNSCSSSIPPSPTSDNILIEKNQTDKSIQPPSFSPFDTIIGYSLQRKTQSAPSSPPNTPSFLDFLNDSSTNHPLASSSYSDLVNKYCFYGSQDTSSSSPAALSMNG
ncbi:putative phosphatase regulatory subunit-domain-containing protein [Absidia repens]|uniref:Putative phosphatase regulatory subunit-domain-containing protein n=1 Tax=Absidia repens TaxID=90262 RepID=A0A1X2J2D0_9FUNG|nr:putative phosphatase regulatory subunit-domain-containing protein [Absidia repens]